MKTNKQKWEERHEQGLTKLDVAIQTQLKATQGEIEEVIDKAQSKIRKVQVDVKAEAKQLGEEKADKQNAANEKKLADDKAAAEKQAEAEAQNAANKQETPDSK